MRHRRQDLFSKRLFNSILLIQVFALAAVLIEGPTASAKDDVDPNDENRAGDRYSDPALRPAILPPPEKKLPDSAEEIQLRNSDGSPNSDANNSTVLKGRADASALSASAQLMTVNPLSRYRGESLVFYRVQIKNSGPTPVVILGRDAQVTGSADSGRTIAESVLEKHDNTLLTKKQTAAVYGVGIGSAGLASILFYEHMTPTEHRKRDLGLALGRDRGRHEVESENLGTRLIMPGDETLGWLAFDSTIATPDRSSLGVPIMFPPYNAVAATLRIPVTGTTSDCAAPPIDKSPAKQ
jgi:hypothetical protein